MTFNTVSKRYQGTGILKGDCKQPLRIEIIRALNECTERLFRAKTTSRVSFDHYIVHYGFAARIHSDQGANLESNLIKEFCNIAGVEKSRTTPYHPMGNGQVERFNQTLLQMLGTLEDHQKSDWKAHVHWSTPTTPHSMIAPATHLIS